MNIKEAQDAVKKFVEERNWDTPAQEILIHLYEELGEVSRNVLKKSNYGGQHVKESEINMDEELADVFYLLLKLSNKYNVDLSTAFEDKMAKNTKRFNVNK